MAQTVMAEATKIRASLKLPEEVLTEYEERAKRSNVSLDVFLARKLVEASRWNADAPIYLGDGDRKVLEHILARNLQNSDQLIHAVRHLAEVSISDVVIPLKQEVLSRIQSRCPRNEPPEKFLERTITMLLEQFVGLR